MEAVQSWEWEWRGRGRCTCLNQSLTNAGPSWFNLQFIQCTDCIVHNKVAKEVDSLLLCVFGILDGGRVGGRVGVIVFGGDGGGPVGGRTLNAAGTCRPSLRAPSHHLRDRRGKRDRDLRHSDSSSPPSHEFSKCVNSIRHFISVIFSWPKEK